MSKIKILLVDPDPEYAVFVRSALSGTQYDVLHVSDASGCIQAVMHENAFSLILIEYTLSDLGSGNLCSILRNNYGISCSITLLSAAPSSDEVIKGLQNGADNFLNKSIPEKEFLVRIHALLRSSKIDRTISNAPSEDLCIGELRLDSSRKEAYLNGRALGLSRREYLLLAFFCRYPNMVLSRETIYRTVWQSSYGDVSTVTVTIKKLRDKLGNEHSYIQTIWGVGYLFSPTPKAPGP